MSFQELSVNISAVNMASPEFSRVAVDAARMGDNIRVSASAFTDVIAHAEAATVSLRTAASAFSSVAHMGSAMISLAGELGIVDKETAKWARTMFYAFSIVGSLVRVQHYLTVLTTGHSAAIVVNTTAQNANAGSSLAVAAAHKVKATATWVATAAQNALNISHATFLALTGVGIGVIIAAAAAMGYFASQMNAATSSLKEYNAAASETPTASRKIIRAGELDSLSLLRRGVEP